MKNIYIYGIPTHAGALFEGTEQAPKLIREAGLVSQLKEKGFSVVDFGDIELKDELVRHNVPPVRNWPSPRIVWESIEDQAEKIFSKTGFTLFLGGDCSIEVGTFSAFRKVYGKNTQLLVLDGHVDTMEPSGNQCIGAAGMGLWFLLEGKSIWWKESTVTGKSISVIGPNQIPEQTFGMSIISMDQVKNSINEVKQLLASLSSDTKILVHFDVDLLHEMIMPAAYAPNQDGLGYQTAKEMLSLILSDSRVKGLEITEFSAVKEQANESAKILIDLIANSLPKPEKG
ncbi:arginase family protein [Bacillus sp. 31A1R]|uniref:Arginase family protein n=1 Tax=Robertmurraya mangrovi TaxID=3098077 RepID=A0ABU5J3J0_9BACI|nr:arginase family protein [Bacillus sp. 31A1R]MDZ5473936.1 arginase family protein [Bacillus sp. 31A1R]